MNKDGSLDIRQLQAFEKLCCTNSFTQTAKHLHVTQSAISHSIRGLEEDIGSKLVLKKGRKIILTEAGERLLEFTRPMLEGMVKVREEISEGKIDQVERVRIGASDQICRFLLPDILSEFAQNKPSTKFEVRGLDTLDCLNLLSEGEIDLALTVEPIQRNEYSFVPCFSDEIVVVLYPEHSWTSSRKVLWEEADREKFIFPNRRGYTFRKVEKFLKEGHFKINSFIELNSSETIKELIIRKLGIGIMSDWSVQDEIRTGKLIALPFGPKRLIRTWGVSFSQGKEIRASEKKFIECVENLGCKWTVNKDLSSRLTHTL
jgi:DNA-binding transcriptional LysR family regulator